ncbi:3-phosphoshikimate 1-carboxyvinyltransferase [Desulforegula conservatrix]|uniref:3-phosphoshikimate 1-carboxyvinyltransferase n=1 Tax=Desulforegula conservatrix TaxID=153026 RepID=UPI0004001CC2|nr:3-phosphoshikimate 1-carboxyvinyltransferase [Desulforegula conservatrix]
MIEIKTKPVRESSVIEVPGSKSYSHRILIAAALAGGSCRITNLLRSEDVDLTAKALEQMGAKVKIDGTVAEVYGMSGSPSPSDKEIYLGNSGTSMRLLTGIACLGKTDYVLTGTPRMQQRPLQELLDGLTQIGAKAVSKNSTGCPPAIVNGSAMKGGKMTLDCRVSSQYLSSVLLMAPCTSDGIEVNVIPGLVSKPYVDLTLEILERFGINFEHKGYDYFKIPGGQKYMPGEYRVESDASQASYFWGSAAITGTSVKVMGVSATSRQGDAKFADVLERMGCTVIREADGITVKGGKLKGVDVDMGDMPDVVPTLGVVAAFAEGETIVRNVEHLKAKESDRLAAVATELNKMGIDATDTGTGLVIKGGKPKAATIETYDDHRMAMCFAMAGLVVPGMKILEERCVEKSFPTYWEVFERLYK